MSLDPIMAAVAAAPKGSVAKLCDAARVALAEYIRAGGRPPPWAAWCALDASTRELWSQEAERVELERVATLAKALSGPEGLVELLRRAEPETVAATETTLALDAAEARDGEVHRG